MTFAIKVVPGYIKQIQIKTALSLEVAALKLVADNDEMEIYVETERSSCSLLVTLSKTMTSFSFHMHFATYDLVKIQGLGTGICYLQGSYECNQKCPTVSDIEPAIVGTTRASGEIMKPLIRDVIKTTSGLIMCDFLKGKGPRAVAQSEIVFHIVGIVPGQTKPFANTTDSKPLSCILGVGVLVPGLDEGITGMREGGVRNITVPPHLGCGQEGNQRLKIPPNTDIQYEVKLMKVIHPAKSFATPHYYA